MVNEKGLFLRKMRLQQGRNLKITDVFLWTKQKNNARKELLQEAEMHENVEKKARYIHLV